ncbi:MAG: ABC transporter ATP-binding protein [Candidatus Lokiarchaeota archaeon]|nr:ABC transporter ATP-binding protein [Candidatus Lokiarchaeota archaeon]
MPMKKGKTIINNDEEYIREMSTLQVVKRLYGYIGLGNRKYIYIFIIAVSFNALFSWFTPLLFKIFIDEGIGGGLTGTAGDVNVILLAGTLFFIFTISGVCIRIIQNYIIQKLATKTMYNLRSGIFNKLQFLGLDYYDGKDERTGKFRTTGKIISYATSDVNTIQELIGSGMLMVIGNFFLVFGALIFMIILSPHLTLFSFLLLVPIFVTASIVFRKARKYFKELRERVAIVNSVLDESIIGMRIIQSFAVEEENFSEFNKATYNEMEISLKSAKLFAFIPGIIILTMTIGIGSLIIASGFLVRQGLLTPGTIVAFIFYLFTFFEPIFQLVGFFTLLQNSISACERIIRLLNAEPSITDNEVAMDIDDIKGKIEYRNVNFEYEENTPILKNIDITIREKERLALVGYTGAGKTTFIKLISRFYDTTKGEIYLDGLNLRDIKINSLKEAMGIVLQETFLFSETIMDNIKYGKLDATDEEVIEAAKKVSAHEFIIELEDGYNTIVGERGSRLSEGQRQLIAFARALIADPPILILDEATSSVDPYSELLIQQALETLLKGRTSISIAHRLSTIINAERILVLDNGEIIEEGTHDELVKKDGFYNHLYKMQFKDPFKKEKYDEEDNVLKEIGRLGPQDLDRRRGGFGDLF